jgi:hypothetical protein
MSNIVTEGSSAAFTVAFLDEAGVATLPTAVRYRIDCLTTGAEILTWTSLSAATSVSVPLTAALNLMQAETNARETRRVTVEASYASSGKLVDSEDFVLENSLGL